MESSSLSRGIASVAGMSIVGHEALVSFNYHQLTCVRIAIYSLT